MAQQQDVFEEHVGVIAALTENYTRRDDALTVEHIHNVKAELNRLCDAREIDAKDIIKGMFFKGLCAHLFILFFLIGDNRNQTFVLRAVCC